MAEIKLDFKNSGVTQKSIMEYKAQVEIIHKDLHRRANDEKDFVGWLDLPTNYDKDEFERIKKAAKNKKRIRYFGSYWNWWFVSRCKSCNRSIN